MDNFCGAALSMDCFSWYFEYIKDIDTIPHFVAEIRAGAFFSRPSICIVDGIPGVVSACSVHSWGWFCLTLGSGT